MANENSRYVCEGCWNCAYEEGAPEDIIPELLIELGNLIADHICELVEEPDLHPICVCACRSK